MKMIELEPQQRPHGLLGGLDESPHIWGAIIGAGASLIGGYLSSKKKSKSSSSQNISRTPGVLQRNDLTSTAYGYRDMVNSYMKSEPGLNEGEKARKMKAFRMESEGATKGQQMRTKGYMSQRGIRGAGAAGQLNRIEENRKAANYGARVNLLLNEHAIRESDIARRAAVASGFLWPAEAARGAGQVSSVQGSQSLDTNPWGAALGAAARYGGQIADAYQARNSGGGSQVSSGGGGSTFGPGGGINIGGGKEAW